MRERTRRQGQFAARATSVVAGLVMLGFAGAAFAGDDSVLVSSRGRVIFPPAAPMSEIESPSSTGSIGLDPSQGLQTATGDAQVGEELTLLPARAYIGNESIIGSDDRRPVKYTDLYPQRAVVLITLGSLRCSGSLVGPDVVLTAGHCVFDHGSAAFIDPAEYRVYPGRDGSKKPFPSCGVEETLTSSRYIADADDRYDFGLLLLDCSIGDDIGWFGLYAKDGSMRRTPVHINGYPGDKPLTQWKSVGQVSASQQRRIFYRNDTTAGTSGAGVYFYGSRRCDPCILGVHAYGLYGTPPFSQNNHATRITPEIVEMILEASGR